MFFYPPPLLTLSCMHTTEKQYWRGALMAIHYWKGNCLNMTGVCYGELCSSHLYCKASLSVSTSRSFSSCCLWEEEKLVFSVVFFRVTVLITIFICAVDRKVRRSTTRFILSVGLLTGFIVCDKEMLVFSTAVLCHCLCFLSISDR